MTNFLTLVNGLPRLQAESSALTIYDQTVDIVSSGATPPTSLTGPVVAGTSITLPSSKTYTSDELEVWLNSNRLEEILDYTLVGSAPRTQVQITFNLIVGDRLRFRIDRGA